MGAACCPNTHMCFCLCIMEKGKVVVVSCFQQLSAAVHVSWSLLATTAPLYKCNKASSFLTGVFSHKMFSVHCKQSGWIQDSLGIWGITVPVMPQGNNSLHKPKGMLTYITGHQVSPSNPCENIILFFYHSLLSGEALMQIPLQREKDFKQ